MNSQLDELLSRWNTARQNGAALSPEEVCRDCPDLLDDLKTRIAALESMERMVDETVTRPPSEAPAMNAPTITKLADGESGASTSVTRGDITVPGYEILGELGRGGMGVVYKARQLKLNRIVALKMILAGEHASQDSVVRFLAESEAVAALQHPNIVQIYDSGHHNGLPYFTLEYVDGGSLSQKVRDNPLPAREAAALVEQIARAVHYAHTRGVLHRDLKPDNVLLTGSTGLSGSEANRSSHLVDPVHAVKTSSQVPKITDFGLAKRLGDAGGELTNTGAVMGTPSYMSPEQAAGKKEISPATDVWSLGAILYRLVTGRAPFVGANHVETIRQVIDDDPVSPSQLAPGLPRDIATICLKCLQKEPGKRYASAEALAEDLKRYAMGEPIVAQPLTVIGKSIKWIRRNRALSAAALAIMLVSMLATSVSTSFAVSANRARKREQDEAQRHQELRQKFISYLTQSDPRFARLSKEERNRRFDGIVEEFLASTGTTSDAFARALASANEGGTQPANSYAPGFFGD